jgi:hypothetical protein
MRSNLKDQLAQLREALLSPSPEAILACLPGLAEAISTEPRADLRELTREIAAIRKLIQHGERMNRALARILGEQIAGYTSRGAAEAIPAVSTISIKG